MYTFHIWCNGLFNLELKSQFVVSKSQWERKRVGNLGRKRTYSELVYWKILMLVGYHSESVRHEHFVLLNRYSCNWFMSGGYQLKTVLPLRLSTLTSLNVTSSLKNTLAP